MAINITDTLCSLVMVWILIPKMGIYGYITLIIVSEIFNASASIYKLVKVTKMHFNILKWFFLPVISIIISTHLTGAISLTTLPSILLSAVLYFILIYLLGVVGKEEIEWIKNIFKKA